MNQENNRSSSITQAVILAAGLGLRLRDVFTGKPKGLLAVDDIPLVERSVRQLLAHGINDIIIVTGYLAEEYEALAAAYTPCIRTVHNPYYAESGSMYSLYCARAVIDGPFLLLESDLLYEDRALSALLGFPADRAILVSDVTGSNDEMYVEVREACFYHTSKERNELQSVLGEMAGISKISKGLFERMIAHAEQYFQREDLHWHYEDGCLNQVAKEFAIPVCYLDDLVWTEIDNAVHLQRAQTMILPKLRQSELGQMMNVATI